MHNAMDEKVKSLSDAQAVAACDALILILGKRLKGKDVSQAELANYENLIESAGPAEKGVYKYLNSDERPDVELSAMARAMLLLTADLGFTQEVEAALLEGQTHVRDFGVVSIPLALGALAVILAWVPVEERKKIHTKTEAKPDGTTVQQQVSEVYKRRVGAAAVEAFSGWVKEFVTSGAPGTG